MNLEKKSVKKQGVLRIINQIHRDSFEKMEGSNRGEVEETTLGMIKIVHICIYIHFSIEMLFELVLKSKQLYTLCI